MTTTLAKNDPASPRLEVLEGLGSFVRLASAGRSLFRKEVLRVGRWVHPETGSPVVITRETLEKLAANTTRYLELGHKVPAPDGHVEATAANRGWWLGFTLEGDKLFGVLEVENPETAATIGREIRDVSVFARPWTASDGTKFDQVLLHVCVTSHPVIPGQENFVRLAASPQEASMLKLDSKPDAVPAAKPEEKKLAADGALLAAVKKICGLPPEADEAAAVAALEAWAADEAGADTEVAMAAKTQEIEGLKLSFGKQLSELSARFEKQSAELRLAAATAEVEAVRKEALAMGVPMGADTIKLATQLLSDTLEANKATGRHLLKLAASARVVAGTKVESPVDAAAQAEAAKEQAAVDEITRTKKGA